MGYRLGVDLGTTYTAAALHRDGRVEVVALGDRSTVMPSVAFVRDDGEVLVGEAANRRAVTEPERVAREFKRRLGDPTPLMVGGAPYPAEVLTSRLLRAVLDEVSAREGTPPDGLALTHPANWGAYKLDFFRQTVEHAEVGCPVTYLSEPEAAALHYAAGERVPDGAVVAVYDLGGGTFDAAVLRRVGGVDGSPAAGGSAAGGGSAASAAGFTVAGRPEGIERLGGADFDAAVYAHVDQALGGTLSALDPDDPVAVQAAARLRLECVDAKEALSRDGDVAIPVVLPGTAALAHTVRLTRSELETMVRPGLVATLAALRRALAGAGVAAEDVHAVLLVGGSSRIPLVAQMVSAELGRPVAVDAHPKHVVAQGAAVAAARVGAAVVPVGPPAAPVVPDVPAVLAPAPPASAERASAEPASVAGAPPAPPPEPPPSPPARPRPRWLRPALAGAAAVLVLLAAFLATRPGGDGEAAEGEVPDPDVPEAPDPDVPDAPDAGDLPPASGTPPLGTDPDAQVLIDGCAGTVVDDCDRLYGTAPDSEAYAYARTCGNRLDQPEASGTCVLLFDVPPGESDGELQRYVDGCHEGAVDDCDRLYSQASGGPSYMYARTCGNRLEEPEVGGACVSRFDAVPANPEADMQRYIEGCAEGAVDDCDRLYYESSDPPSYQYARTCGNRLDRPETAGDCVLRFDAVPTEERREWQALIDGCAGDDVAACDRIYDESFGGPTYMWSRACGNRLDTPDAAGDCLTRFPPDDRS
jgi:hypothetical protein